MALSASWLAKRINLYIFTWINCLGQTHSTTDHLSLSLFRSLHTRGAESEQRQRKAKSRTFFYSRRLKAWSQICESLTARVSQHSAFPDRVRQSQNPQRHGTFTNICVCVKWDESPLSLVVRLTAKETTHTVFERWPVSRCHFSLSLASESTALRHLVCDSPNTHTVSRFSPKNEKCQIGIWHTPWIHK